MRYLVIVEKGPASFGAYVPDLPGCIAAGESKEEVLALIHEAIEFHIEGLKVDGLPVPPPASYSELVEIAAMPPLISERYLQDDQLKAIGCMEVETAFLDHWIDLVIRRICGFDNAMFEAFIQETMPISGKLRVLRDIVFAKCKEQNKRAKFESWYSKLTTQITKRNTVVHGKWTAGITLADLLPDTRKSDAVVTKKRNAAMMVKATEIAAIATAISELAMDMLEMLLFDEPPLVPLL